MDNAFACDDANEDLCVTFFPANHYPNIPKSVVFYHVVRKSLAVCTAFVRNISAVVKNKSRDNRLFASEGMVDGKKVLIMLKNRPKRLHFSCRASPC